MDLNEIDWGAQVEVRQDGAGSGIELTLALLRKQVRS